MGVVLIPIAWLVAALCCCDRPCGSRLYPPGISVPTRWFRGSTTGFAKLDPANLEQLPRFQMCRRLQKLSGCDARFVAVVQAVTVQMGQHLQQRLNDEQLITAALPLQVMAQSRWLLDVDGNVTLGAALEEAGSERPRPVVSPSRASDAAPGSDSR